MSQTSPADNKQTERGNEAEPSSSSSASSSLISPFQPPPTPAPTPSSSFSSCASFALRSTNLEPAPLKAQVSASCTGAVVAFEGLVRDHNEGKSVSALTYEAFEPLCQSEAEKIFAEAQSLHPFHKAICHHRIGDLAIGDMAVYVAVSSPHRDEAFKACRYIIDEIKHRLPIWKKETYTDGTTAWVNCSNCQVGKDHNTPENHPKSPEDKVNTKEHHYHGAH